MSINSSRNTLVFIKEIELVNGSNDFIYDYYLKLSSNPSGFYVADLDSHTELKLLEKNDKFLDVVLAQYCFFSETITYLFKKSIADDNLALRLACLSNMSIGKSGLGFFCLPKALFNIEINNSISDDFRSWFSTITTGEIYTLFKNETIDGEFLTEFLQFEGGLWDALDDDKKVLVLISLADNTKVCKNYDGPMDGYAEYLHSNLFSVIWDLAKKLPVEKKWGFPLGYLLDKTNDFRRKFNSLEVAKRWSSVDEIEKKKQDLNGFESIRFAIYKDVIKDLFGEKLKNKSHYANEDVAYRACAYVQTDIKEDDIKEAYKKDGLVAIEYIMRNLRVWKNEKTRNVLKQICRDADSTSFFNHLDCANMFKWKRERLVKQYPSWFEDKDESVEELDEDEKPLSLGRSRELIQEFKDDISNSMLICLNYFEKQIMTIRWIFYGVLALLFILLFR